MKQKKSTGLLKEARRPVKCKIKDWAPLEESVIYKDMIAMGWERVTTAQRQLMGNLQFRHPEITVRGASPGYPIFKINHHGGTKETTKMGTIMVRLDESLSYELNNTRKSPIAAPEYRKHEHLIKVCAEWEDYLPKMDFLMKLILKGKRLFPISDAEMYGTETYAQIIKRKCRADASLYNKIEDKIPPSVKEIENPARLIKSLGIWNEPNE